jgi:hypothetical protein
MENYTLFAVLLLGLCQIAFFVALAVLIRAWAARKQEEIEQRIDALVQEWVSQPAPNKPSKLALLVEAMGNTVGAAAARSIMATFKAESAHTAAEANRVAGDLEEANNPLMSVLAGGARGKGAAVMKLAQLLLPMIKGAGNHNADNGGGEPPRSMSL